METDNSAVRVAVRVRPQNIKEASLRCKEAIECNLQARQVTHILQMFDLLCEIFLHIVPIVIQLVFFTSVSQAIIGDKAFTFDYLYDQVCSASGRAKIYYLDIRCVRG